MKLVILSVLVLVAVVSVNARPRYIAIPLENVELVEVDEFGARASVGAPLVRVARQTARRPAYVAEEQETEEDTIRFQRQAGGGGGGDGHDHVDYGAHTGHHGAFGWYADFPVHKGN